MAFKGFKGFMFRRPKLSETDSKGFLVGGLVSAGRKSRSQAVLKLAQHLLVHMAGKGLDAFMPLPDALANLDNLASVVLPPVHELNMLRVAALPRLRGVPPHQGGR